MGGPKRPEVHCSRRGGRDLSYAHCERCDTEILYEGSTHDCVHVLRLRLAALESAFNRHMHLHVDGTLTYPPDTEVGKKGET